MGAGPNSNRRYRVLTEREQAFCRSFVATGNAQESAKKAGYSKGTAEKSAYLLLRRPAIAEEVERLQVANRSAYVTYLAPTLTPDAVGVTDARRQIDAAVAASLDRTYCIAGLWRNAEIALGMSKVTVTKIKERRGKDGNPILSTSAVEVFRPDAAAANQALDKLAKLLPDRIKEGDGEDRMSPETRAVIEGFRAAAERYRARTGQIVDIAGK